MCSMSSIQDSAEFSNKYDRLSDLFTKHWLYKIALPKMIEESMNVIDLQLPAHSSTLVLSQDPGKTNITTSK